MNSIYIIEVVILNSNQSSDFRVGMAALNKWTKTCCDSDTVSKEEQGLLRENEGLRKENCLLREERELFKRQQFPLRTKVNEIFIC